MEMVGYSNLINDNCFGFLLFFFQDLFHLFQIFLINWMYEIIRFFFFFGKLNYSF